MNSLPLISHHLFVAAAAQDRARPKAARSASRSLTVTGTVVQVPLELLEGTKAAPPAEERPLRVSTNTAR